MSKDRQIFTFITRSPPYGSNRAQLCLDAALASAVFEQTVNYVFLGDGLLQLLSEQNAEQINSKTLGSALETLDLYGIENVFVEAAQLQAWGLSPEDLLRPVATIDDERLRELIDRSDAVFNL